MRAGVIVFPGSNCDRDAAVAIERVAGKPAHLIWHKETSLPKLDIIVLPGGFSFGDYLRPGAMAARSPVIVEVVRRALEGAIVLGICNGFQVLTETGLLPGALMRNAGLDFICHQTKLEIATADTVFTSKYRADETVHFPIAHLDGNYFADDETLNRLEKDDRIVVRYGEPTNGSQRQIAGLVNERRNVFGLMPHPERAIEAALGSADGVRLFESVLEAIA